jgi:hypothetical protein
MMAKTASLNPVARPGLSQCEAWSLSAPSAAAGINGGWSGSVAAAGAPQTGQAGAGGVGARTALRPVRP